MLKDWTREMKVRMRADLVNAIKGGRTGEIAVLRSLLAAIDNAEAPPVGSGPATGSRSEIERLVLTAAELEAILLDGIRTLERAAAELVSLGHEQRAEALLDQAAIGKRYLTGMSAIGS